MQSHPGQKRRFRLQNNTRFIGIAIILSVLIVACSPQQPDFPTGQFINARRLFTFLPDGTFIVWLRNVETMESEEGRYTVDGNKFNLGDEECPTDGEYTWQFDGRKLEFDRIEDECEGRPEVFRENFIFQEPSE